jgi:hypothetical protein
MKIRNLLSATLCSPSHSSSEFAQYGRQKPLSFELPIWEGVNCHYDDNFEPVGSQYKWNYKNKINLSITEHFDNTWGAVLSDKWGSV